MKTLGDIFMKFKYCIIILLLVCFICGSTYASDINSTDAYSQDTDSAISVSDQSIEIEDFNGDGVVLQNNTGPLSSEGGDEMGDDINHIYFDSSVYGVGTGTINDPYHFFNGEYITDNSVLHFAEGKYLFTLPKYDMGSVVFNNVEIIGDGSENTVIDFYNTQLCILSLKGESHISNITADNFCFDGEELEFYNVVVSACNANGTSYFYYCEFLDGTGLYAADGGGAIYSSNNNTVVGVYHSSFINNTGELGGAINMEGGLLYVYDCLFANNTAGYGGVIYMNNNATVLIDNCSFINNTADFYGGVVTCDNIYYLEINNTNFDDNTAVNNAGGAIYVVNSYYAYIENTNITNSNALMGGAITCLNSTFIAYRTNVKRNSAVYYGGGLYARLGEIAIFDCDFINNTAINGGGLFAADMDYCRVGSRFTNNSALIGGAIYSSKSNPIFRNEYCENTSLDGTDWYNQDTFNLIFNNEGDYPVFKYNPTEYATLPDYYNLCDYGWVSPVKDQINNGNCWAFTAFAVLESAILKASNNNCLYDFSEENMKNLIAIFSDYGLNVTTNDGGSMDMAVAYLVDWLGPVMEEDDLYGFNTLLSPFLKSIFHVQNAVFLKRTDFTDNDMIKGAILKYGAVGTNMFYHDYFLNNKTYAYYCYNYYEMGNHAVTIVGWNDTYSKDNFKFVPEGNGAWIVKNSWGSDWGADGYFYVSYYDKMFAPVGVDESSYAILLNDTIKYDKIYQYDICKSGYGGYDDTTTLTFYNIFEIESDEYLAAVSTYFDDKYDYKVEIYVNDNLKSTLEGCVDAGYYTIPLNDFLAMTKGDKLKVSFTITNLNGEIARYAYATNINQSRNNIIERGNSIITINNGVDLSKNNRVACIKAFTLTSFPATLNVPDMEFIYNESGNITVSTNASSIIAKVINHPEASVNVAGKIITVRGLNVGNYTLSVTTNDTNYKTVTSTANIIINKCDSVLNVPVSFDFNFDDSYTLNVDYTGAVNVTAFIEGNVGSVVVGNRTITVSRLPEVGYYSLIIKTVCDDNHNSVSKTVRFTVNKSNSVLNDIESFEFTYGDSYALNVDYTGAVNVTAFVEGNLGRIIVGNKIITVSQLDVGDYTLNVTTIADSNHNSVSKTVNFTVTKKETVLVILDNNQTRISSVTYDFDRCSPELGVYTSVNVEGQYQKINNYKILFDGSQDNVILTDSGNFYLRNLTVGTYTLHVEINDTNDKSVHDFNITINKGITSLEITIGYGESGSRTANTLASGITLVSAEYRNYINIDGKFITVSPGLNVGVHKIRFTADDTNWQSAVAEFTVNVIQADSYLDDIKPFEFSYASSGTVTVTYANATGVKAFVDGHAEDCVNVRSNTITVSNLDAGNYSLTVSTVTDNNHKSVSKIVGFTVKRINPDLNVTATYNHGELEIQSNYDGSYSSNLTSDFTVVNGVAHVQVYLNPSDYTVNIQFKGNRNYNAVSQLAGFKVKSDTLPEINIPEITLDKSNSVPVVIGNGASGTVRLMVDGKIITVNPLVDGSTVIDIPELTAGEHTILIFYSGDGNYNSFTYTKQVSVTSHAKITASDMTVFYLDGSAFSVCVFGDDGNPLAGARVTFRVAGTSLVTVTDSDGYARFTPDQMPSTYTVSCEAGSLRLIQKLTVKPVISAKALTTVKKSKKVTKIKITLKGQSAYKNKKLTVKFNSKKYNLKTNTKGVAVFKVTKKMVKKFNKGKKVKYTITYVKSSLVRYVKIK